jgi:hypothetical protein
MRDANHRQTKRARALCFSILLQGHEGDGSKSPPASGQPWFPTQLSQQTRNQKKPSKHGAKPNNRDSLEI